jgi:hypothetical protein
MRADGAHQRQVTEVSAKEPGPYFSPGGDRIVMKTGHGISTVRTDGSGLQGLVSGALNGPEYSPNGKRIAFWGVPDGKQVSGIWRVRRDGSHLRRLTRSPVEVDWGNDMNPDWRPDGRRIVYAQCREETERGCGDGGIYSIRPGVGGSGRIRPHRPQPGERSKAPSEGPDTAALVGRAGAANCIA